MITTARDQARVEFLDLVIPQLWAGGYDRLAAEYSVERDRLRETLHCVACGVEVTVVAVAVRAADALCGVTPDSTHTLNPESVEIGATTSTLAIDQPGSRWLFFTSAEARGAYLAMYGHRYDYVLEWMDVAGFALEAICTQVTGGQGYGVPEYESLIDFRGRRLCDVDAGEYDDCDISCSATIHDRSCDRYEP